MLHNLKSLHTALINGAVGLLVAWVLVRYRFPGPAPPRRADRPAVRAADRGRRHRADRALRAERLDRRAAGAARHRGRLHAARHRGRADLHRPALRRAHGAAGPRGSRARGRGGRRDASAPRRCRPSAACVLPALLPALLTGFALAFARGVGEYGSVIFIAGNMPMRLRDRAAADRHQARAVRLCRRRGDRRRSCCVALLRHPAAHQSQAAAVRWAAARHERDRHPRGGRPRRAGRRRR